MNTNVRRLLTLITAKNAEGAKVTVTTNSKRTHNELRVRTSSYQFAVKMKLCEHSAWYGKILIPQYRTRMTRINRNFGLRSVGVCFAYPSFDKTFLKFFGRIFTDNFVPCASVSSVRSVFYRVLHVRMQVRVEI